MKLQLLLIVSCLFLIAACGSRSELEAPFGDSDGTAGSTPTTSTTSTVTTSTTTATTTSTTTTTTTVDLPNFSVWRHDNVESGYVWTTGGPLEMAMMLHFSAETETVLESMTLKDVGAGSLDDLASVMLYNGYPGQGYKPCTVDTDAFLIVCDALELAVTPDEEQYYSLYVMYDAPDSHEGMTHRFALESADMLTLSGERDVIGDFPIESATQTLTAPPDATYCDPWDPVSEFGYQGCCGTFLKADAILPGTLFKGSLEMVYYLGSDGKRYTFPTTMILDSWYGPYDADGIPLSDGSICDSVIQVPDDVVASIQIGAIVTFKPGVFITGIPEDPQRYVVSKGHVLRPLEPTDLQEQIYPGTWSERTRLTMDGFFVDFFMGAEITDPVDYDPIAESETTLEQDLGLAP